MPRYGKPTRTSRAAVDDDDLNPDRRLMRDGVPTTIYFGERRYWELTERATSPELYYALYRDLSPSFSPARLAQIRKQVFDNWDRWVAEGRVALTDDGGIDYLS